MPTSIRVTSATQQPALKKDRMITSDQAFQRIPLPFPSEPCPVSSLTWHLEWTYQSCVCQQLDHSSKRKHRRSFSGSHLAGEVFLGPPSALQHSRAQSPLPLPGQSAQGHGEKNDREGQLSETSYWSQWGHRRKKQGQLRLRTKGLQRWAKFHSLTIRRKGTCFSMKRPPWPVLIKNSPR